MRNEATICSKIKSDLSKLLPGAIVYKHHDVSTIGMPDLSVHWHEKTTWLEVKFLKRVETWKSFLRHFDQLQLAQAILLSRQQRTFYLVAYPSKEGELAVLWEPTMLKSFLDNPESKEYDWRFEYTHGTLSEVLEHFASQMRER